MKTTARLLAPIALLLLHAPLAQSATIVINNLGLGFNDVTPVTPVGGNPGTTRGEQRLNVYLEAASRWGLKLSSAVPIRVDAAMKSLTPCDASGGTLGSTMADNLIANFTGAEFRNTWYPVALANKQHGTDLDTFQSDMQVLLNVDVDNPTCLGSASWYYGYDHNAGNDVDMLAVVMHEFAHGLGFASYATLSNGDYPYHDWTDVFSRFLYDDTQQLYWDQMTNAQRQASALNDQHLVWRGGRTMSKASTYLGKKQFVRFEGPAAEAEGLSGDRPFGIAQFGPALDSPPVSGECVLVEDPTPPVTDGCELPWSNAAAVLGKIAVIDRGLCEFTQKAEAAQDNGAIAVIIVNDVAAPPIVNLSGTSPSLTIPAVSVTLADGNLIKNAMLDGPVTAVLGTRPPYLQGADDQGWPLMYAPTTLQPGASVSHFDVTAFPDLLMEPGVNPGLTDDIDLTWSVMQDIGWVPRLLAVDAHRALEPLTLEVGAPNPFRVRTSIGYALPRSGVTEMGVYDVTGRLVKQVLPRSWQPAGHGSIVWDGTNYAGVRVAPGLYLYRVRTNGETRTQRVVVAD